MTKPGRPARFGPRITVSVTSDDYDILTALADRQKLSVSWVVRRAIDEYLQTHRHEVSGQLPLRLVQEREKQTAEDREAQQEAQEGRKWT